MRRSEGETKTDSESKTVPQNYAWEFGGWDLFCISCLGEWGSGAKQKEELGNSGASSCTDLLRKDPPRSHNTMMSLGRRGVWEFTIRVLGFIKYRCAHTPTQWKDNVTPSASCEGEMSAILCVCKFVCVWMFKNPWCHWGSTRRLYRLSWWKVNTQTYYFYA